MLRVVVYTKIVNVMMTTNVLMMSVMKIPDVTSTTSLVMMTTLVLMMIVIHSQDALTKKLIAMIITPVPRIPAMRKPAVPTRE